MRCLPLRKWFAGWAISTLQPANAYVEEIVKFYDLLNVKILTVTKIISSSNKRSRFMAAFLTFHIFFLSI